MVHLGVVTKKEEGEGIARKSALEGKASPPRRASYAGGGPPKWNKEKGGEGGGEEGKVGRARNLQ
jgi:hypothetical protein